MAAKKKAARKKKSAARKKKSGSRKKATRGAGRKTRKFPAGTLEAAMPLAQGFQTHAAGKKTRRLILVDQMGMTASAKATRALITCSGQYGLTNGSYNAEYLSLTPEGKAATAAETSRTERTRTLFKLGLDNINPFKLLYEQYKGNKLPSKAVMQDFISGEIGDDAGRAECVDTFLLNLKYLGLLREVAGAERILSLDHALESPPPGGEASDLVTANGTVAVPERGSEATAAAAVGDWSRVCFYVTPIGDEDSLERKHSDLFLNHLIEPALADLPLDVVRADQIGTPGMINSQVMEYIARSRLVVADLSFHNPNVFYELSLRHACGLPVIHVIQKADKIPFDIGGFRTVAIDNASIYTLLPKLETYQSEIADMARSLLAGTAEVANPITTSMPGIQVGIPGNGV